MNTHLPRFDGDDWIFCPPALLLLWPLRCCLLHILLFNCRCGWCCWWGRETISGGRGEQLEVFHVIHLPFYILPKHHPTLPAEAPSCALMRSCVRASTCSKSVLSCCSSWKKAKCADGDQTCQSQFKTFLLLTNIVPRSLDQWSRRPPPAEAEVCRC